MKNILVKMSNWRFILPLFILFLIFPIVLFPYYQGLMTKAAGQEIVPLDSRFSYTYEEAVDVFDDLGAEGRDIYRTVIGKVDNFFAVVYGPLFILVLAWLLKKTAREGSSWIFLAWFPLIGILFEYLENFNTLSLLDSYPAITQENVVWGSQMTSLKQIFLLTSVALMLLLALALVIKRFTRRKVGSVMK